MSKQTKPKLTITDPPITPVPQIPTPVPQTPVETHVITLAELQAMCEKKLTITMNFAGKPITVEARRLTPEEDAQIDQLLSSVIPPVIRGRIAEEDRADYANLEFVKKAKVVELEARAVVIYWCVPMFAAERPGLRDRGEITTFIQTKLNHALLSTLFNGVRDGGVKLPELINFT